MFNTKTDKGILKNGFGKVGSKGGRCGFRLSILKGSNAIDMNQKILTPLQDMINNKPLILKEEGDKAAT